MVHPRIARPLAIVVLAYAVCVATSAAAAGGVFPPPEKGRECQAFVIPDHPGKYVPSEHIPGFEDPNHLGCSLISNAHPYFGHGNGVYVSIKLWPSEERAREVAGSLGDNWRPDQWYPLTSTSEVYFEGGSTDDRYIHHMRSSSDRSTIITVLARVVGRFQLLITHERYAAPRDTDLVVQLERIALDLIRRKGGSLWEIDVAHATTPFAAEITVWAPRGSTSEARLRLFLDALPSDDTSLAGTFSYVRPISDLYRPVSSGTAPHADWYSECLEVDVWTEGAGVPTDRGHVTYRRELHKPWVRTCSQEDFDWYEIDMPHVAFHTSSGAAFAGVLRAELVEPAEPGGDPRVLARAEERVVIDHIGRIVEVGDLSGQTPRHSRVVEITREGRTHNSSQIDTLRAGDAIRLVERPGRRDHVVIDWIRKGTLTASVKPGMGDQAITIWGGSVPEADFGTVASAIEASGVTLSSISAALTVKSWVLGPKIGVVGTVLGVVGTGLGVVVYMAGDVISPLEIHTNSTALIDLGVDATVYMVEGNARVRDWQLGRMVDLPAGSMTVMTPNGALAPVAPFRVADLPPELTDALHRTQAANEPRSPSTAEAAGQDAAGGASGPPAGVLLADAFDTENDGAGTLTYTAFANWVVREGSVDLIGNGYFDHVPGHGLYLDLDGSTGEAGTLATRDELALEPGRYLLEFALAANPTDAAANTVTVTLGSLYTESFTRTREGQAAFEPIQRTIDVARPTRAHLVFRHEGGDNLGLILDDVRLTPIREGAGPPSTADATPDAIPEPRPPAPATPEPAPQPGLADLTVPGRHDGYLDAGGIARLSFVNHHLARVEIALRSPDFDTVLELYDDRGVLVAANDDDLGTDSRLALTLDPGTYRLDVSSYDGVSPGAFTLELMQLEAPATTEPRVAAPGALTGYLEEASIDTYVLELDRTALVTIDLNSTAFDTVLDVYDAAGARLADNDDFDGTDARVVLRLAPGTYVIDASAFWEDGSGPYTITFSW